MELLSETPPESCPPCPDLLNHLWVLLHDVEEPIALLGQGGRPLFGAAGELLEEISDNVV